MAAVYTDGTYTSAAATSAPVFEATLPHTTALLVLRQKFCIAQSSYAALALNTAHATYSDYKLVAEGPQTDLGEGIVEWERIYAKVPDTYTEPAGNYTYNFIGFYGSSGINATTITGRFRFTRNVASVVTRQFYLVGSGQTYTTPEAIPTAEPLEYYADADNTLTTDYLDDGTLIDTATTPTRTEYEDMMADDAADPSSFSVVVEARAPVRWMGNIWMVETLKVKAI